jgi:hypothetical protein
VISSSGRCGSSGGSPVGAAGAALVAFALRRRAPAAMGNVRTGITEVSTMSDFSMTIAGKPVPGEQGFGVINPATGQVFAQAPEATRYQMPPARMREELEKREALDSIRGDLRAEKTLTFLLNEATAK